MPDGKTLKGQARVPLGIVVERRAIDNPWIDYRWKAVGVIPGAAPLLPQDEWTLLGSGEDWVHYHAGVWQEITPMLDRATADWLT